MKLYIKLVAFFLLILSNNAFSTVEPGSFEEQAKQHKWEVNIDQNLPNILLLGDSISIGYTLDVRSLLQGKANVYRPMKAHNTVPDNCGSTLDGLKKINHWLETNNIKKWDVIHFNWGLHDLKRLTPVMGVKSNDPTQPSLVSIVEYKKNLSIIVKRLKETGARLVFATTTPYPDGVTPSRLPKDVVIYNTVAVEVMNNHDVDINDIYEHVKPELTRLQRPKNVHFKPEGSKFLAKIIALVVETELRKL